MKTALGMWVGVAVVVVASTAFAQAEDDRVTRARAVFAQAESDYAAGAYALALQRFEAAYELLEGHPRRFMVLFNMGRCNEELGRLEAARTLYRRFLDEGGASAEIAPEAQRHIADIEARLTLEAGTATSPEPARAAASEPRRGADPAPWILFGAGGVVLATGVVLLAVGLADAATVDSAAMGTEWSSVEGAYERSGILPPIGIAALSAGAAVMIGALVWAVVDGGGGGERARLGIRFGLASIHLDGRF